MATNRISDSAVEHMQVGDTVWDTEARGFGVRSRVRDKVYLVKTRIKGKQHTLTIGRHAAGAGGWTAARARKEAIRLLGLVRDGQDPAGDRAAEKAALTFKVVAARYMNEHAAHHKKRRTIAEDDRLLKLHLLPALGTTKARDIDKPIVKRVHTSMSARPVTANRALALLSAIMGWAESVGERPDVSNPCRHVQRYPEKERERWLSAPELARLGEALDRAATGWSEAAKLEWRAACTRQAEAMEIPPAARSAWIDARMPKRDSAEDQRAVAAYRLLIFTGARLSEVLTLRWSWINPAQGVARLPDSKTGAKSLYLPPGALAVLETLPRVVGNEHVLWGERPGSAFVGVQKPWQRIRALAALSDVRIHDLRHSFASVAVAAGDSLFIVGKLLGHRQSSTTERYAHLAPDPALAAATRTAERLAEMLYPDRAKPPANLARPSAPE